jgi:hypothetical protein
VEELEGDARAVSTGPETELRSQMGGGGRQNARPAAAVAAARKGTADLPRQTELQTELFIGTTRALRKASLVCVVAHLLHLCSHESALFDDLVFGARRVGERCGGRSWSRHDRPHSGRGGCLGGVARPDGEVKFVFFPWRGHAFTTGRKTYKLHSLLIKL